MVAIQFTVADDPVAAAPVNVRSHVTALSCLEDE